MVGVGMWGVGGWGDGEAATDPSQRVGKPCLACEHGWENAPSVREPQARALPACSRPRIPLSAIPAGHGLSVDSSPSAGHMLDVPPTVMPHRRPCYRASVFARPIKSVISRRNSLPTP